MTTNRFQRTARITVLSTFLVLVAFAFLTFGSASAHALSRPAAVTQTATVVKIISTPRAQFSPSAITVKSGSLVKIVNKTAYSLILFTSQGTRGLGPGRVLAMNPTQTQGVRICGGGGLLITVV